MIKAIIFDFSRVILFPKEKAYQGGLNPRHDELSKRPGYSFFDHFELNDELLKVIKDMKKRFDVYVFTTGHIQNVPEVRQEIEGVFKKVISAEEIPFGKKDPQSYLYVLDHFGLKPNEVLYIDDTVGNIEVANKAGISTIHFTDNDTLMRDLRSRKILV